MSRTFHDLSDTEKQAYRIWKSRVELDHTTPEEKAEAKREMEKLLWEGPGAIVHELQAELRELATRVVAIESTLSDLLNGAATVAAGVTAPPEIVDAQKAAMHGYHRNDPPDHKELKTGPELEYTAPEGEPQENIVEAYSEGVKESFPDPEPTPEPEAPAKKKGRGRPGRRYVPEKNVEGKWMITDRVQEGYVQGPYKLKKDADADARVIESLVDGGGTVPPLLEAEPVEVAAESPTDQLFGIGGDDEAKEEAPTTIDDIPFG